ncbi:DUF5795 family protein [Halococcus hamelinensis]|uniref:Small CPxCG-related zinc finger protein n=1 Tax=Halococcus hamelinensis 100A6 TaxID=1132509 RepID=M0M0M8_9EURY|nr:DUF5795 family protein [Halococcus hamelinensis]EMA39231.1 hypothetical protein C447_06933 [Halococcus hamelinensis 100A6]
MAENRVVEGRMVTPKRLAAIIEGDDVMDAEPIADADRDCPECGSNVLEVGYMPSVAEFVTGQKCQECEWHDTDRE